MKYGTNGGCLLHPLATKDAKGTKRDYCWLATESQYTKSSVSLMKYTVDSVESYLRFVICDL
jgi:hypothetical protein